MRNIKIAPFIVTGVIIFVSSIISAYTLFTQSIRLDEAQSLWFFTKSVPAILNLSAQDVNLPLYGLFLHFWIQFFGTDITVLRILSFLFYLFTIPVIYVVGKENSNQKVALVSVVLFALSPFIIWYSGETRTYTLFVFLTTLSNLFFLRIINSEGKVGFLGYFISIVLGFYTHYFFFFLVFTQASYLLVKFIIHIVKEEHIIHSSFFKTLWHNKRVPLQYLATISSAFLLFIPWIWYVLSLGSASNTKPLIPTPTTFNIFQAFENFLFGFQSQNIQSTVVSLWPLLIGIFFFIFTQKNHTFAKNISYFLTISFVPVVLIFVLSFIHPIFLSRYLIFVTPTLFFLMAWVFMSYSKKIATILITLFIILSLSLSVYQTLSSQTPVKEDYEGVSQYLDNNATPSDIIAVSSPFTIYPMEYTYRGTTRISTIPKWNRYTSGSIPPYTIKNLQIQLKDYESQYKNLFVVLSYNQGYENSIKNYLDNHYQRTMLKKFSPNLELRVYKLRYNTK